MADRRNLRERAKQAGKSVAGTLSEGAQKLKEKATTVAQDDETGITISEVEGQYLIIDSDGSAIGPYDDKMKAASKARELKREKQTGSEGAQSRADGMGGADDASQAEQGRVQQAATRFAEGVNKRVGVGDGADGNGDGTDEPGRIQQFATEFTQGVNEKVAGAADDGETDDTSPQLGGDLGGLFGGETDGEPEFPGFGMNGDGEEPTMPMFGGGDGEPQFPGFGGGDGEDRQFPGFGGGEGDPEMPAFGPQGDVSFPGFGMESDNMDTDEPQPGPERWF